MSHGVTTELVSHTAGNQRNASDISYGGLDPSEAVNGSSSLEFQKLKKRQRKNR